MTNDSPFAYWVEQSWIIVLTRVLHASIVVCQKYTEMYGKKSLKLAGIKLPQTMEVKCGYPQIFIKSMQEIHQTTLETI